MMRSRESEFQAFAAGFLPALLKGAYLLLRDVDLAEDAVQGTMLRVFRNWERARVAPEAYSRQALVSVCRDHWRRSGRRPAENLTGDASSFEALVGAAGTPLEDREALKQALALLPEQQREVLVLRFYFDLSVAETAAALGVPVGTVKSATHRGLEQLRVLLTQPAKEVESC